MVVIYHIAPPSAIALTPVALLEVIFKGDVTSSQVTTATVAEVAVLIVGAGLFSFMLIFAEVRSVLVCFVCFSSTLTPTPMVYCAASPVMKCPCLRVHAMMCAASEGELRFSLPCHGHQAQGRGVRTVK